MAVYKTKFCRIGYNDEITTSTDPEDVCTGLGLDGGGVYKFPVKVPSPVIASSLYTRNYFISSSSIRDTGYHNYDEGILVDEDQHGNVGAIRVKISGLNTKYGITSELVILNGHTPVPLINHYHRINDMKVVTIGRSLSNVGDIYVSALNAVRTSTVLDLNDYVSSGVPISGQLIYAKIPGSDNRMLSSHYTVPRSHTLYIDSIRLNTDVVSSNIVNWKLMAGVNGSLHVIYKGRISSSFTAQAMNETLTFKDGYTFPSGSDIVLRINTVGATTDVSSIMEGYLISQVQLELENEKRKVSDVVSITRAEELIEDTYRKDSYTDEEFSDVPDYSGVKQDDSTDAYDTTVDVPSEDEGDTECPDGYTWCESTGECLDVGSECI